MELAPPSADEQLREAFRAWVKRIEDAYGYTASLADIGAAHDQYGAPTQMAVFRR